MKQIVDLRIVGGVRPNFDYGKKLGLTEQEIIGSAELTLFELENAYDRQKVVHLDTVSEFMVECECGRAFSRRKRDGVFRVREEDRVNYCNMCGARLNWRERKW